MTNEHRTAQDQYMVNKILSTSATCIAAALITYPAEISRIRWEAKNLRYWNPEYHLSLSEKRFLFNVTTKSKEQNMLRKRFRVLSPMIRLTFNEAAGSILAFIFTPNQKIDENQRGQEWKREISAGVIAGMCQSIILTPLEAWRTNVTMLREKKKQEQWRYWITSQVLQGWTGDPEERRQRSFRGIGVIAVREIVFNVTFFPLFYGIQRNISFSQQQQPPNDLNIGKRSPLILSATMVASGVSAGMISSVIVTPMDILRSYMMHSRQTWSLWSGTKLYAVPITVLSRGLILQAFCFGPAFGVAAAVYELA